MSNWVACEQSILSMRMLRGGASVFALSSGEILTATAFPRKPPQDALLVIDLLVSRWFSVRVVDLDLRYHLRGHRGKQTLSLCMDGHSRVGEQIRISVWLTEKWLWSERLAKLFHQIRNY